ncbi:hypothetical protein [Halovivax cerinus]|uniref:Small CPxCG-related zinc finger protein n=1 Tax=Halovivax cerinus TaxID=1487865 RepID=A0ABD5NQE6_9EURY|nr:hypothetical protein [Halovivax cerinus]
MTAADASSDAPEYKPRGRECYRCTRDVAPQFLFRVTVESPAPLSETYADGVRYCCEDCAAAMNLSDFSRRMKRHAGHGDEVPDG